MNQKSPLAFAEPLLKSGAQFGAGMLEAAQRVRQCQKEGIDNVLLDYKTLFEQLQEASSPQETLGALNDHLQSSISHSIKTWTDLRQAISTNQSSMLSLVRDNMKSESKKLSREVAQDASWMLDPVSTTITQWNQMASAMMAGDGHAEAEPASPRKPSTGKGSSRAHAEHASHSAHNLHAGRHV